MDLATLRTWIGGIELHDMGQVESNIFELGAGFVIVCSTITLVLEAWVSLWR